MKRLRLARLLIVLALITFYLSHSRAQRQDAPQEILAYPNIVLYDGQVLTATDNFAVAEAVAIRDGKFLAVGSNDHIRRMAGPETQQIDLKGRSVVPGLFDTHLHQAWIGQVLKTGAFNTRMKDVPSGLEEIKKVVAKDLGVVFSVAPKYLFQKSPDDLIFQYGADRVNGLTPVRTMLNAGMKPVMEADVTGDDSAPLWLMEMLITRNDGKGGRTWGADQKITCQEALWMKTNWAARYSADEKILGTIEAGKLADLVVLGGDYMTVPENQISKLPIDLTIMGGKVMYDRNKDGVVRIPYWDKVSPMDR